MTTCVFRYCKNSSRKVDKSSGITFHRFAGPSHPLREEWLKILQKDRSEDTWLPTKHSCICSAHFQSSDMYTTKTGKQYLRKSAVPRSSTSDINPPSSPTSLNEIEISDTESIFDPPSRIKLKKDFMKVSDSKKTLTKKYIKLRRQHRCLQKKAISLTAYVKNLTDEYQTSDKGKTLQSHSEDQCLKLISLYGVNTWLWKASDPNYTNRGLREDTWFNISREMNVPVAVLKKKMESLMGSFRREKSREKKSRLTASGCDDVYKSRWFAYNAFAFLSDRNDPCTPKDTMENIGDAGNSSQQVYAPSAGTRLPEAEKIIASVYRYLQAEYENLKSSTGNASDLSPLANILKRTSAATGVSEQIITDILEKGKRLANSAVDTVQNKRPKFIHTFEDDDVSPNEEESSCGSSADVEEPDEDEQEVEDQYEAIETLKVEFEEEDEDHSEDIKKKIRDDIATCETTSAVQHLLSSAQTEVKIEPPNYQQTSSAVHNLLPSTHVEMQYKPSDLVHRQADLAALQTTPNTTLDPVKTEPCDDDTDT